MAIQINYTDRFGANHPTAYCKIIDVNCSYGWRGDSGVEFDVGTVFVSLFTNKDMRLAHKDPVIQMIFKIENLSTFTIPNGTTWRAFLYSKIKTDAFLTGGIDV